MDTSLATSNTWSVEKKMLFRFFALYFFLFSLFMVIGLDGFWDPLLKWLAHSLNLVRQSTSSPNGSGDSTDSYLQVLCTVCFAFIGSIIWSVADHKRKHYDKLLYWLFVLLRYMLAYFMATYGFSKIFKVQFPFPYLQRLLQPYGASSPMGLAWTFMGYSRGFNLFTGCAEALGGILLLFRRTSTFGALFSMTVLTNIVAMNLCYDIPVKIFSIHLLLIAMFVVLPDLRRLINFFFLNKAIPAKPVSRPFQKKWMRITHIVLKVIVVAGILASCINDNYWEEKIYGDKAPKSSLYGIYTVDSFVKNDMPVPPLLTDSLCWRYFVVDRGEHASVRAINDKILPFSCAIDTVKKTIAVKNREETDSSVIRYTVRDKDHLVLAGKLFKDTINVVLKKKDMKDFLLVNRGFHWINEFPYNR